MGAATPFAADQVHPGDDIAPLVAAAHLRAATGILVEPEEVIGLQRHVDEFGERDAIFTADPGFHGIFREHVVDREMLAGIAHELEQAERFQPIEIVAQLRAVRLHLKVEVLGQLDADVGDVCFQHLAGEQLPFARLAAGVTDEAGAAPHEGDWGVAGALQAGQPEDRHEVPNVQAGARRVKSVVDGERFPGQGSGDPFGRAVNLPAPLQFFEDLSGGTHRSPFSLRLPRIMATWLAGFQCV